MKSNFKITFHRYHEPYQTQIITASSAHEATLAIGDYWTIRSTTVQCAGTTKAGEPCQRFTSEEYCCEAHKPKRGMDIFTATMIAEGVDEPESEEQYIEAWQTLIDTGTCWSLQGWFGRTAASLIEQGICHAAQ